VNTIALRDFLKYVFKQFNVAERSKLEMMTGCDLLKVINQRIKIKMVEVSFESLFVDTQKDLEYMKKIIFEWKYKYHREIKRWNRVIFFIMNIYRRRCI